MEFQRRKLQLQFGGSFSRSNSHQSLISSYASKAHQPRRNDNDADDSSIFHHGGHHAPESEFDEYLRLGRMPSSKDTTMDDVLRWWKTHEAEFPNVAAMARDYLAIPATSAPSERLFSSGRQLVTDFRSRLSPATIRACQCLKSWFSDPPTEPTRD